MELELEEPEPIIGNLTYEDYKRLPDDGNRYEIIDGVLYVSSVPSMAHQLAVRHIGLELYNFTSDRKLGEVISAPFEVLLTPTTRPVQPDVLFISTARWPGSEVASFEGVPDLVVEVLSPSTVRTDRVIKFSAYERAGVAEYWIVDPILRVVEVNCLDAKRYTQTHVYSQEQLVQSKVLVGFSVSCSRLFGR